MNRIFTLLLISSLFVGSIEAKERTNDEKVSIASSVLGMGPVTRSVNHATVQLLKSTDTYAVLGNSNEYVVVSNDDSFDAVIAYSRSPFTPETNSSLAWFLHAAAQVMKSSLQNGETITRASVIPQGDFKSEVAPLCKSLWSQSKPFNNLCPTTSKGKAYPTGCVATALSQIMYFHKYPVHGKGSHQYSFTPATGDGRLLSWDFENSTFDWANMIDDYSKDYTDEQANAVANLMAAVGVSVDMQYTEAGSGAMSREARYGLINYFGYNANINWMNRSFYSAKEWMRFIYTELNQNRPIYYTGDDTRSGGHAFVLDGYDEQGLVHINWGWGPNGDNGFYDIALLNPAGYQFSEGQDMLIGISSEVCLQYESRIYSEDALSVSKVANFLNVQPGKLYNQTGDDFTGDIAVIMEASDGTKYAVQTAACSKIPTYYYINGSGSTVKIGGLITLPTTLPDGDYRVYIASKCDKDSDWRLVRRANEQVNSFMVVMKDGKLASVGDAVQDDSWVITGIEKIAANPALPSNARTFNLQGQRVEDSYHGVVIKKGKKYVQ